MAVPLGTVGQFTLTIGSGHGRGSQAVKEEEAAGVGEGLEGTPHTQQALE